MGAPLKTLRDDGSATCELLFVSKKNIAQVVARVAPNLVLVDRTEFAGVAEAMLVLVERAAVSSET